MDLLTSPLVDNLLVVIAAGLLVFVSVCVIYLSLIERRDRQRRDPDIKKTKKK